MLVKCHHCGKEFNRDRNQVVSAKFLFCSRECKSANSDFNKLATSRSADAQRFGGEGKGYVKLGGKHMHRVIAEQKLGRALLAGEIVGIHPSTVARIAKGEAWKHVS